MRPIEEALRLLCLGGGRAWWEGVEWNWQRWCGRGRGMGLADRHRIEREVLIGVSYVCYRTLLHLLVAICPELDVSGGD